MADQNSLVYNILVGRDELGNQLAQIMKQVEQAGKLSAQLGKNVSTKMVWEDTGRKINANSKLMKEFGKVTQDAFNRGNTAASRFDARLLSLLFGGMALKRAFGGILRGIQTTFLKAEDETSGLTQATTRLTAAWEFFKFSLADALNTPFFLTLIDGLINVINKFSQMGNTAKVAILGISAGLFALGTALMIIGQVKLGWNSIFNTGGFLAASGTMMGVIAGIIAVLGLMVLAAKRFPEETKDLFESFKKNSRGITDGIIGQFEQMGSKLGLVGNALDMLGQIGIATMGILSVALIGALSFVRLFVDSLNIAVTATDVLRVSLIQAGEAALLMGKALTGQISFEEFSEKTQELGTDARENIIRLGSAFADLVIGQTDAAKSMVDQGVSAFNAFRDSTLRNIETLPIMTEEVNKAKDAIDAIPNHTTKVVEIKTIHTGGSSRTADADRSLRNRSSVSD